MTMTTTVLINEFLCSLKIMLEDSKCKFSTQKSAPKKKIHTFELVLYAFHLETPSHLQRHWIPFVIPLRTLALGGTEFECIIYECRGMCVFFRVCVVWTVVIQRSLHSPNDARVCIIAASKCLNSKQAIKQHTHTHRSHSLAAVVSSDTSFCTISIRECALFVIFYILHTTTTTTTHCIAHVRNEFGSFVVWPAKNLNGRQVSWNVFVANIMN